MLFDLESRCKVCGNRGAGVQPDLHWNKAVVLQLGRLLGEIKKRKLTMTKSLLVCLAILTLSSSAALAAHRSHHHHAMNASAAEPAPPPQVGWMGGLNSSDHTMYLQNLHDSGYNPKNDFNAAGNIAD
jgi:hypothetical protein